MKTKAILMAALAAVTLQGCGKTLERGGGSARLHVTVSTESATRATGVVSNSPDGESKVSSFQVFVFNASDGTLDAYKKAQSADISALATSVDCTAGQREVYALVNTADVTVSSKAELLAKVSQLASTTAANFEMVGNVSRDITGLTSVEIPVNRFASRVVVRKVTNNLASGKTLTLDAIYLTNIAGDTDYAVSGKAGYTVSAWYCREGYDADPSGRFPTEGFCHDAVGASLAAGGSHDTAHYVYGYPNDNAPANGGAWSERATKLVLKVTIDSQAYYYPIQFSDRMEANRSYEFENISLTRLGNKSTEPGAEDTPLSSDVVSFSITVKPWNVTNLGSISL